MADRIPDDAIVVRGGRNLPENFAKGSGVNLGRDGRLEGVSVNAGSGLSIEDLTAPNDVTGYPGIPNTQIGVSTAGAIRAAGGDVVASPSQSNPHHATLSGLTPEIASELFRPTRLNPHRAKSR